MRLLIFNIIMVAIAAGTVIVQILAIFEGNHSIAVLGAPICVTIYGIYWIVNKRYKS